MNATLALEDGTILHGEAFGALRPAVGEVVFNTSMTGYQEVLTDPSYRGQMVTMTASHIGNTGVNAEDVESERPRVTAFIVRELSPVTSNWRSTEALSDYLARYGIPGISQVDTRYLTRIIRERGAMKAALAPGVVDPAELVARARMWPGLEGRDLVREVTCPEPYSWTRAAAPHWHVGADLGAAPVELGPHVVAYDFGIKHNILRRLTTHGCRVTVVPADTSASGALALEPDGVFLSNGPGDPAGVPYAAAAVAELLETGLPIFGICLGHQILGLAVGGCIYKLKFGHHGGNHPVQDITSGRVQITAQNHNYAVAADSLPVHVEITHWNLNDNTVEGLRLTDRPVFSVQYHPEASPGPHDADDLFERFVASMPNDREGSADA
jgi:carbamoyl-phosphate synthase small subunit